MPDQASFLTGFNDTNHFWPTCFRYPHRTECSLSIFSIFNLLDWLCMLGMLGIFVVIFYTASCDAQSKAVKRLVLDLKELQQDFLNDPEKTVDSTEERVKYVLKHIELVQALDLYGNRRKYVEPYRVLGGDHVFGVFSFLIIATFLPICRVMFDWRLGHQPANLYGDDILCQGGPGFWNVFQTWDRFRMAGLTR
jgi:hypothetical protein